MKLLELAQEKVSKIFEEATDFSTFCQQFKMAYWKSLKTSVRIPESDLDELAMIAFNLLK